MPHRTLALLCLVLAPALAACASKRPALYPNTHLEEVGPVTAEEDIDACLEAADTNGYGNHPAARTAANTVRGGATGGAVGAAAGAVRGRAGRGAGMGGAGGGAGGFMRGLFQWREPDPLQARFVGLCLREQGYHVIGWK